jgi:hypothetical protein
MLSVGGELRRQAFVAKTVMSDAPENLILVYLRRIDTKVDLLADDVRDLKGRVSAVENGLIAVRRDLVLLAEADARQQVAIDRLGARVDRVDTRLDLRDT